MGRFRVLIADDDVRNANKTKSFLNDHGFEAVTATNGVEALKQVAKWKPHFVIIELLIPRMNAIQFLQEVYSSFTSSSPKVLVVSNHSDRRNIKRCIDLGAIDYVIKPFSRLDLLTRILFHTQGLEPSAEIDKEPTEKELPEQASKVLHLFSLLLKQVEQSANPDRLLFNLTRMMAEKFKAVRCSIVQIEGEVPTKGIVLASSDDKNLPQIKIDLNKYPEMTYCHRTGKTIAIENLDNDRTLSEVKKYLESVWFNSLLVCPIKVNGQSFGVISARFPPERTNIDDFEVQFMQVAAQIIGLALSAPNQEVLKKSA